jgi:hypothetical protein
VKQKYKLSKILATEHAHSKPHMKQKYKLSKILATEHEFYKVYISVSDGV